MTRKLIAAYAVLLVTAAVFVRGPIPQDPCYHEFADGRTVLGVPNGLNVFSNLFLVLAGSGGLFCTLQLMKKTASRLLPIQYLLFFSGVFLSGIGSSWYHLGPSNASLIWDRLPMAIAFMALSSSVISETIDRTTGARLLAPLVVFGLFSVGYWAWTESMGRGDLRPYALVQFVPVIMIPALLILYKPSRLYASSLWLLVLLYVAAKIFELLDRQVFVLTGMVSGHTVKHVTAALGVMVMVGMLYRRRNSL